MVSLRPAQFLEVDLKKRKYQEARKFSLLNRLSISLARVTCTTDEEARIFSFGCSLSGDFHLRFRKMGPSR
jgi:hypothetical protein